ncbi:MAG: response regulator transcription factor [Dethiobacter sp.]|jgi:DNA-binding NarL/FixJ family response regulator|nr:response regulator transcription factor [Dethiobacter sp.]
MIRVLIADDHALFAESLQLMLQQGGEIQVVGLAAEGSEAVELSRKLSPDVVLMDIKMGECDGLSATGMIKETCPATRVIILTTFGERANVLTAVSKGADGYILKDIKPEKLVAAVKCVCCGFSVFQEPLSKLLREELTSPVKKGRAMSATQFKDEEIAIIKLISDGKNNREIAEIMNYAEGTIKNRISRMMEMMGVKDRTQVVLYALKNDLI